jgi:hypothetical protein
MHGTASNRAPSRLERREHPEMREAARGGC